MKRILVFVLVTTLASASLGFAAAQDSRRVPTGNWLQYRRDNQRSGFNPHETQITPANQGSLRLMKILGFIFDGPTAPLIYGNTLFTIATSFLDPDTEENETSVYAVDISTGRTLWTQSFRCRSKFAVPAISTTAQVLIVPLVTGCGSVTGSGSFLGLDLATGSIRWGGSSLNFPRTPTVVGGKVFVTLSDDGGDFLQSIEAATGAVNWSVRAEFSALGDPSVGGGVVFVRERINGVPMLTAISASTGVRMWTTGSATGNPAIGAGRAYVSCDTGICAYNKAGTFKWSFPTGVGEVAFANGTVYTACQASALCAVDAKTGSLIWSTEIPSPAPPSTVTSVVVAGGVVFAGISFAGGPGWIEKVDAASGVDLGRFGPGANNPVVVNGRVYLVSENRIYIYGLA